LDYLTYLSEFDNFAEYPKENKHGEYIKYLEDLRSYLESFFGRVKPLSNLEDIKETTRKSFHQQWESGKFPGWEKQIGSDEDKSLFCAACRKGYKKQTVFDAHLTSKKHIKAANAMVEQGITSIDRETQEKLIKEAENERDSREREIAFIEALIRKYAEILGSQREDTKANVERKRALTDRERRLHGLGVEYPCEICGNYVYMGRKAFDRHFQEWRHAHGMRCLGIPNTRHFHEITLIEDAYALWEKLKSSGKTDEFKPDTMEEFEDQDGNNEYRHICSSLIFFFFTIIVCSNISWNDTWECCSSGLISSPALHGNFSFHRSNPI
ncbi:9836_t:CDS:2, partial [Dentiscutata heterogama]